MKREKRPWGNLWSETKHGYVKKLQRAKRSGKVTGSRDKVGGAGGLPVGLTFTGKGPSRVVGLHLGFFKLARTVRQTIRQKGTEGTVT